MATGAGRLAAAAIALIAWAGLVIQFAALLDRLASPAQALWEITRYFTIATNLVIALLFTGLACGVRGWAAPRLVAGVALAILLVGVVQALLLRGLVPLTGVDAVADVLLHAATPILVPLFWLAFARKGALRTVDPLLWALYPLAYLIYALARGAIEGRYAYPFLDVAAIGWSRTALNAALIAIGFVAVGTGLVALDGCLGRRQRGR